MIIKDSVGNELLELIQVSEDNILNLYSPVTHALAVVKLGDEYLMGFNHYRQKWEIFGGCIEKSETVRECIIRECEEELGIKCGAFTYIGLLKLNLMPGYFNRTQHIEYGALFGITLTADTLNEIERYRTDKDEIEELSYYSQTKESASIAEIDDKLLQYWI